MSRMLSALQRLEAKSSGEEPPSPQPPGATEPEKPEQAPRANPSLEADAEVLPPGVSDRPSVEPSGQLPEPLEQVARLVELAQQGPTGLAATEDHQPPPEESQPDNATSEGGSSFAPGAPDRGAAEDPATEPEAESDSATEREAESDPATEREAESDAASSTEEPDTALSPAEVDEEVRDHWRRLAQTIISQWTGEESAALMFTSPEESESRTSALASLAEALGAEIPGEVLVVDANLSEPALAARLGVASGQGLVDVLDGTAGWQVVVRRTCVEGLALLPGRAGASDKSVRIAALAPLLEELRARYRFVLLNAASVGCGDTAAIARYCDGVYLWIRLNRTPCHAALEAIDRIERRGGHVAGCVLTDVPAEDVS
jgi:Mrp family chromosome partitioning ATPase